MKPPNEIFHLSPSSVSTYARCRFQYFVLKVLGYREPSGSDLVYGFAHDDAVNWDYGHKKTSSTNRPKDDVKDYFRSSWEAKKDEVLDWEEENPSIIKEQGTKGVDIFYDEVMKVVVPVEVQLNLELPFKGTKFKLVGRPDFLEKIGAIGDNKTSRDRKPDEFISQGTQPVLYSLMLDGVDGKPREVRYDILVRGRAKTAERAKPYVQQLKMVIDPSYRAGALKSVSSYVTDINNSLATKNFPANAYFSAHAWACKRCGCKDLCRKVWGLPVGLSKVEVILKGSKDEQMAASAGDPAVIEKLKKMQADNEALYDKAAEVKRNIVL